MLVGEDERGAEAQHPVHLAQDPVEVLDLGERVRAEHQVDGVGAQEGEVAAVPLDPDFGLRELAGPRELRSRCVERERRMPWSAIEAWPAPQPRSSTRLPFRSPSRRSSCSLGSSGP